MKIAEVSEQHGISTDTLRYYERIGLIPPVNRRESGIKDYNELDIRRVEFVKCMRSAGLPIEILIEYIGLVQHGCWLKNPGSSPFPARADLNGSMKITAR